MNRRKYFYLHASIELNFFFFRYKSKTYVPGVETFRYDLNKFNMLL